MAVNFILPFDRSFYRLSDPNSITGQFFREIYVHWCFGSTGLSFGGIRAYMEDTFDNTIFISGFITNTLLAAGLAYLGDRLGVELYLAAVVVFGVRLFQNLGIIRRYLLKKY